MTDLILPVLDEADAIPSVLANLPEEFRPIVVDNGSTDGSGELAARHGALVLHESRRGFGAACARGLAAASSEVVCFMDCDGSFSGDDLPLVCDPVLGGDAELVLGTRRPEHGAWPLHARLANRALTLELRRRTGLRLADLGPMRAAPRRRLIELQIKDRRFGWPLEMILRAFDAGWRIREVEVGYSPRVGRSKVTGTARGTLLTARDMARALR